MVERQACAGSCQAAWRTLRIGSGVRLLQGWGGAVTRVQKNARRASSAYKL